MRLPTIYRICRLLNPPHNRVAKHKLPERLAIIKTPRGLFLYMESMPLILDVGYLIAIGTLGKLILDTFREFSQAISSVYRTLDEIKGRLDLIEYKADTNLEQLKDLRTEFMSLASSSQNNGIP